MLLDNAADEAGWDPQPGLALVRLAQGNVTQAAASIREALEHPLNVPSKELPSNTELRRAPLLEAAVEIEIAAGELDRARSAADELEQVAARFESKALAASAALAQGRVRSARGDTTDAERHFELAARLWNEVGAPYETALARMGLRDARGEGAQKFLETPPGLNAFRREGDYWSVSFEQRTVRVRDLKGMHYLARLLADPGREFHVMDLVALESGVESGGNAPERYSGPELQSSGLGDAGEMLDARAKEAYRRRLAEIEADIDEAQADGGRATQGGVERDFLVRELSRAFGLGGRERKAGSASERARVSVTRAVRQAMTRIREHHPPLAQHLDYAIRTGTHCAYLPDPRVPLTWGF
jgi:tetratricopeptide (TPR) repeat protein